VFANPGCRLRDGDHWIDRWHRFGAMTPAAFAGTPEADAPDAPYLTVDPADRLELDAWLRANGCENAPLVLLQPGNKRTLKRGRIGQIGDPKRWPSANWTALVRAILERCPDARIVLCGTPREARLLGAIAAAAHSDRVLSSTDGPTLRRLLALCERAVGMISIDSGPAHAAAALGCPLIVLYGPARPSLWLPRSPTDSAVVALGGLPGRDRVDQIAPDEAVAAWRALPLRNHAGGHGGIPA
jgi:heptosyltransferase-2/heptosyltransferase-3